MDQQETDSQNENHGRSRAASVGLGATVATTAALLVFTAPFMRRFTGAPYVASSQHARRAIAQHMRKLRESRNGELRLTDLGSGGGELVIQAATIGFRARGVELNPWLVALSRLRAWRARARQSSFRRQCLWSTPLNNEDVIVVFGVPAMMSRLADKLANECKPDAWVASNTFELPGWRAERRVGGVYFYVVRNNTDAHVKQQGLKQLATEYMNH